MAAVRDFRFLVMTNMAWYAARWIDITATGWLALAMTGSPWFLSIVGACRQGPLLFLGVFGGQIAERFRPRQLAVAASVANLLVAAIAALLAVFGQLQPWHLIVITLASNAIWALNFPSRRLFISQTVAGKADLTTAMAFDQFAFVGSNVVYSALAGAVLPIGGAPAVYVLAFLLFLVGLPLALAISPLAGTGGARQDIRGPSLDYKTVIRMPVVAGVLIISVIMNGMALPVFQLLPLIARDLLHVGPFELGLLNSAWGSGSLLGAFLLFAVAPRQSGRWFLVGSVGTGLSMFLFSFSGAYLVSLGMIFVSGFLVALFGTYQSALMIQGIPEAGRPKALGALTIAIGFQPFGLIAIGALVAATDAAFALRLSTGLSVVLMLAVSAAFPQLRR